MTTIEVLLQVPEHIQIGLDSGVYERIGGVIREAAGRKIVAWLRDGMDFGNTSSLPNATQALMSLSGTASLLNVAVSSASLLIIINRLNRLSSDIEHLGHMQNAIHQREQEARFRSALEAARDALEAKNRKTREQSAHNALRGLTEAQDNLFHNVEEAITANQLDAAQYDLTRAMYAITSRIRCYLELEEIDLARNRLVEQLQHIDELVRSLIKHRLGAHEAVFLHRDVLASDVYRFIRILEWLRNREFIDILIEDLRSEFWNNEIIKDVNTDIVSRVRRVIPQPFSEKIKTIPDTLTKIEALIENYQRLQGFELEIRSMRLIDGSFSKWRAHYPEDKGFAVLYSATPIDIENSDTQ